MTEEYDKPPASTDKLHRAYRAGDARETADVYDDWAGEYEQHMKNVGYTHPAMVASMIARHVEPTDEAVLDAGAGTGVLGEILTALGYPNLYGLDASEGMLELAQGGTAFLDEIGEMVRAGGELGRVHPGARAARRAR